MQNENEAPDSKSRKEGKRDFFGGVSSLVVMFFIRCLRLCWLGRGYSQGEQGPPPWLRAEGLAPSSECPVRHLVGRTAVFRGAGSGAPIPGDREVPGPQSLLHYPITLHLQDTNPKIKWLRIPRWKLPSVKPQARGPLWAQGPQWVHRSYAHKSPPVIYCDWDPNIFKEAAWYSQ